MEFLNSPNIKELWPSSADITSEKDKEIGSFNKVLITNMGKIDVKEEKN